MQIIRRYLAGIIVVVCLLSSVFSMQSRQVAVYLPMQANTEMEKRACWISYIDMESELSDKSEAAFRAKVHAMYDTVKRYGLNTVIVHARAMGEPQAVCGSNRGCIYIAGISGLSGYAKVTGFGIQSDDKGKVYEE